MVQVSLVSLSWQKTGYVLECMRASWRVLWVAAVQAMEVCSRFAAARQRLSAQAVVVSARCMPGSTVVVGRPVVCIDCSAVVDKQSASKRPCTVRAMCLRCCCCCDTGSVQQLVRCWCSCSALADDCQCVHRVCATRTCLSCRSLMCVFTCRMLKA